MVADQRKNSSFAGLKLWAQAVLPISAETQKVTLLISLFYVAGDKILSWALNSHLMFSFSFFLNNISPRGKNKWFIFGAFIFGDGPNMHGDAPKLNDPSYPLFFFGVFLRVPQWHGSVTPTVRVGNRPQVAPFTVIHLCH